MLRDALTCSLRLSLALSGSYWISLWLSMALCDSYSGSHCHSLAYSGPLWLTLALSGSLLLSNLAYIHPLIGSQGPCSALIADVTMTHVIPLCGGDIEPAGVSICALGLLNKPMNSSLRMRFQLIATPINNIKLLIQSECFHITDVCR